MSSANPHNTILAFQNQASCAESIRVMRPSDQMGEGGSIPTSALQLWVERIDTEIAIACNGLWHSHLPRLGRGAVRIPFPSFGAVFGGRLYAVAIWSNPAARMLPQREWLELRRLALAPDAPKYTASWMLGVMARLIRREMSHVTTLVSYHDTSIHCGTVYSAAGWVRDAVTRGKDWRTPSRPCRPCAISLAPKVRWLRILRVTPQHGK